MRLARRPGAARRPAAVDIVAFLLLFAAGARAAKDPAFRILSGAPRTETDRISNIPVRNYGPSRAARRRAIARRR